MEPKMEKERLETIDPYATPPKLTLNSFSSFSKRAQDRPGMTTSPIRLAGAIPFGWEEAPGRPKQAQAGSASAVGADAGRRLGLPPRLSASASSSTKRGRRDHTKTASPTTVLDGHYFLIRKLPVSFSVGRPHLSFGRKDQKEMKMRWDTSSERSSVDAPNSSVSSSSSSSSSSSLKSLSSVSVYSYSNGGEESDVEEEEVVEEKISKEEAKVDDQGKEEKRTVRILRYKRKRSLACVTTCSVSNFWASILGRLKQAVVVPCWRDPKI